MQSLQTKPNIISLTPKNSYKLILTSAYSSLGMDLSPKFILYQPKFFEILESQWKDTKLKVLAVLKQSLFLVQMRFKIIASLLS